MELSIAWQIGWRLRVFSDIGMDEARAAGAVWAMLNHTAPCAVLARDDPAWSAAVAESARMPLWVMRVRRNQVCGKIGTDSQ